MAEAIKYSRNRGIRASFGIYFAVLAIKKAVCARGAVVGHIASDFTQPTRTAGNFGASPWPAWCKRWIGHDNELNDKTLVSFKVWA
jgi:hypothetical protein